MSSPFSLLENLKPVQFIIPRVGNGACTGDYVSLKNALKAWIVLDFTEGNAEAVSFQPVKATAVAPTNPTAITTAVRIWSNLDTATSDLLVERTAAVLYAADAAASSKQIVFEIDPNDLGELAGVPYDVISLTATAPNAGDYLSGTIWIQPRYASRVLTSPTALTD